MAQSSFKKFQFYSLLLWDSDVQFVCLKVNIGNLNFKTFEMVLKLLFKVNVTFLKEQYGPKWKIVFLTEKEFIQM